MGSLSGSGERASFLLPQRSEFRWRYPRPKADRVSSDLSLLLLAALFWTLLATFAGARELQSGEGTTGGQTSPSQDNPKSKELPSDPKGPAQDTPVKREPGGQESFIVAPLPISSPAVGTGIVPVFAYIFRISSTDKTSPPSVIGGAGMVTDNGSRAFVVAGDLFFHENTYHATAVYGHGNLNYDLYGVGIDAGNAGIKLPLEQTGQFFFAELLRRVGWKFFVGTRVFLGESTITVRPGDASTIPPPPDVGLRTNLRSLGFRLQRDTRSNRFYPTTGTLLDFAADFFSQGLGSKYSFQSYKFTFNKFASVSQKQVLAFDLGFCGTGGKPPFYGNCIYGTNNQLRGYTAGRYLDRYMLVTQLEYRLVLPKRFGLVGFGGMGGVAPGGDQLFRARNFLPSAGGGIRFLLSKQYHVNLRADVGFGKDSQTWSMGVGEAF